MSKYIRIKNEVPELLEALCNHPDCPEWLAGKIWDTMNDRSNSGAYSIHYLRFLFEASKGSETCEHCDREIKPGQPHVKCLKHLSDVLDADLLQ